MKSTSEVVICGAGIAGISTAYHLAVRFGVQEVLLVDERPPLSLTSDKSTECYRNWWPGPGEAMVALMNRSIDLMEELAEESGNRFQLNRRGYLYVTADSGKIPVMQAAAEETSGLGGGPLRLHYGQGNDPEYLPSPVDGYTNAPQGADLILDPGLLQRLFPYLTQQAVAALHVRRAGWLSAQQLGMYLLEQAAGYGTRLVRARVTGVDVRGGRVQAVQLSTGEIVQTGVFINAAGPLLGDVGRLVGVNLPIFNELHLKVAFFDPLGSVPREAPLLIWTDPQVLPWSAEERLILAEDQETRWLLNELPAGAHTRPEGGAGSQVILMLWEYRDQIVEPVWPPPLDPQYPEVALRGLATMLPGLRAYFGRASRPQMDGGYYTKTRENRPLVGPLPVEGAYVLGALSGYGVMSACAAGELLAANIAGTELPPYAPAFRLERYQDPTYVKSLENWGGSGQL